MHGRNVVIWPSWMEWFCEVKRVGVEEFGFDIGAIMTLDAERMEIYHSKGLSPKEALCEELALFD